MVGSLRDLEQLVRLPAKEIGTQLLGIATEPATQHGSLLREISGVDARPENPILEAAWHAFDLLREGDEYTRGFEGMEGGTQEKDLGDD